MVKTKLIKKILAVIIIAVLLYVVDLRQLWEALSQITLEILLYLILLSILLVYISALKWQYFLEALGSRVSALHLFCLYVMGYFVNLMIPSYVGGDAVRSWFAGKKVGQHEAFTATILERYTGFVAMVSMAIACVWFVDSVTFEIQLMVIGITMGLIFITIAALSPGLLEKLDRFKKISSLVKHLRKIQEGFLLVKKNRPLLAKTLVLSFLFHIFTVVNTTAAAYAVGWYDPPIQDLFVVLPLIMLIGAIPVAPSGLGIQEGAFLFFLQGIGATPAQALGVGVILRAKTYLLGLAGGAIWLKLKDSEPGASFKAAAGENAK